MTARQTAYERQVHAEDEGETARHGKGVMEYGVTVTDSVILSHYSTTPSPPATL